MNGTAWNGWYRKPIALHQLKFAPETNAGILSIQGMNIDDLRLRYDSDTSNERGFYYHIVLLGFDIQSRIGRGENKGRTLEHDFVVLDYQSFAVDSARRDREIQVQLSQKYCL